MYASFGKVAALVCFLLAATFSSSVSGQLIGIEPIGDPTAPVIIVPGQPFEQFYPNVFDLDHPKKLTFEGVIINDDPNNRPGEVAIWFDWLDIMGGISTSPPVVHTIVPGVPTDLFGPSAPMWIIPYCPPQVSIHIEALGPGFPLAVNGVFIHECLIPEPATVGLGTLGFACFFAALRRRPVC
ncbi:MAG: PEP-CTERM sorting domain-containing protein [Pirellulales bacterium]|nr:PEP-CTERM sorting domain-containing protein [Pirellulales bacterium]